MKILILLTLLLFVGCGKNKDAGFSTNPPSSNGGNVTFSTANDSGLSFYRTDLPLTLYVPRDKYNQYVAQFNETEAIIRSASGLPLVTFVPSDLDPKFATVDDTSSLYYNNNEMWVLFKEDSTEFQDITDQVMGLAYYGYGGDRIEWGNIVMNFTIGGWSGDNFRQVLLHEVNHILGFRHFTDNEVSVMNYEYVYKLDGISTNDYYRLWDKYDFSLGFAAIKDVELLGGREQIEIKGLIKESVMEKFGLSESRATEVSQLIFAFNHMRNKRSLTVKDYNLLSQKLLGFNYDVGKKALEEHIQGNPDELESLIDQASELNGVDPEDMKEIISDLFLE